jgi:SAM-dependent methyltransferase
MMELDLAQSGQLQVTLVNPEAQSVSLPNFTAISGDGRSLPQFRDKQFDIVFSNSTIEHVGTLDDQRRMANELSRLGKRFYVQTPNRYFPIEPHFVFPGFQFLPVASRVWLLRHFSLGWYPRIPDREEALREATGIRLMTKAELRQLFPEAAIFEERYCGMTKSFVVYSACAGNKE